VDLNALLYRAVEAGASDIHLKLGRPPMLRRDGSLGPLSDWPELDERELESILTTVTALQPPKLEHFRDSGDLDISYSAADLPRFRVNGFLQRGALSFAFRVIPKKVPQFTDLGLPPGIERLANEHRGLVLVTGATGSGKTTTLAAIIDHINRTRKQHIVTIEDPIEVLHPDIDCIVNQREVGLDTESFGQALRRALRQDPDVILIGELRDAETAQTALQAAESGHMVFSTLHTVDAAETAQTALQAAESGHLVFSTLHTVDAAETVGRMIEFFPEGKQQMIRAVLAGVLKGVISQRLLPKISGGRVAAVEIMVTNARIADLIREARSDEVTDAIAEGEFFQMQTFTQALLKLVIQGRVDSEVAANAATNRHDFMVALEYAMKREAAGGIVEPPPEPAPVEHEDELSGLRLAPAPAPTS
jgi:twitching motility protein PilT